ncbi:hypothetical protein [Chloracidobacterium sp. D]|nr:hypothetical protein [Chloracidobacterium sp. D]
MPCDDVGSDEWLVTPNRQPRCTWQPSLYRARNLHSNRPDHD